MTSSNGLHNEADHAASNQKEPKQFTNEDWAKAITQTEKNLVASSMAYACPTIGTTAFTKTMDHTLLKLHAESSQFDVVCTEAREHSFASVCVRVPYVRKCVEMLQGSDVKVACVVGFHEGTYDTESKLQEAEQALHAGARELDIVLNYPNLKAGQYTSVYNELAALRSRAPDSILLKLILETSQLDRLQVIAACTLAAAANFDFVKTSTGFNGGGATEEHVRLMKACCEKLEGESNPWKGKTKLMQVKASGGIRTLIDAELMLEAGASRLGTSGSVAIAQEAAASVRRAGDPRDRRTRSTPQSSGNY